MSQMYLEGRVVKVYQFLFGMILFALSLLGVSALANGNTTRALLIAFICVGSATMLILDKYFWVVLPFFMSSKAWIPGLKFDEVELAAMLITSAYFVRNALHKEHPIRIDRYLFPIIPLFVWICIVWIKNPAGVEILGSSVFGGRFYIQIVAGFLTFLVTSTLRFSEKDCRIFFLIFLVGTIFNTIFNLIIGSTMALEEYELDMPRPSMYEFLGALMLYTLFFARFSLTQIITSLSKFVTAGVLAVAVLITGKRRAFATLAILPVLRILITGKDKLATIFCGVLAALVLLFAVEGHGTLWTLPHSAVRSLSIVFQDLGEDAGFEGVHDTFRSELRSRARAIIKDHPLMGREGFAIDRNEVTWLSGIYDAGFNNIYTGHSYSGNWHSTWFAFGADFGVPAIVFFAFFSFSALFVSWKYRKKINFSTYTGALYMFFTMLIMTEMIFSITSGHSSRSFVNWSRYYGILLAILNGAAAANFRRTVTEPGTQEA